MSVQPTPADAELDVAFDVLSRALQGCVPLEIEAPVRAGMRARAIADACERLRLPAVLIDRTGRVLHVAASARPLLHGAVTVVADHLVGRTPAARRIVAAAVSAALGVPGPEAGGKIALAGLPYDDRSPAQMLRGVVVIGRGGRGGARRMAALRKMLAATRPARSECA